MHIYIYGNCSRHLKVKAEQRFKKYFNVPCKRYLTYGHNFGYYEGYYKFKVKYEGYLYQNISEIRDIRSIFK